MEEEFIIFNGSLGVHDIVTIGEFKVENGKTTAWLEEPYEMVGPFNLDELISDSTISFAECMVMSVEKWKKERKTLLQQAFIKQQKIQQEHFENIRRYNQQRHYNDKEHRELLCLPLEGILEANQIKTAYRKLSKKVHPDLGGSHEKFIEITVARDTLLKKFSL
ncbi:J domain-containing protein [Sulfurimonas sp.]|uniref:J domain-containing protein n=1 Tax=Sulfurimonas sp. TaxID=2022749 RepID=UPI003D0E564A